MRARLWRWVMMGGVGEGGARNMPMPKYQGFQRKKRPAHQKAVQRTHPGSGLPTIYESGRISANLITGG